MGTIIIFFVSLVAIILLLGLKVLELKRGIKPLSANRYRLDAYLRRKADTVVHFSRYFNSQTFKLIVIFLLSEFKDLLVYLARKVRQSHLGDMVSGRHIPKAPSSAPSSAYLKEISMVKAEARDSSK